MSAAIARCLACVVASAPGLLAAAQRPSIDLQCVALGAAPQLECTVRLRAADGQPLSGATVTLAAAMPSMPMAHSVAPAVAAPTATPGEYRGRLALEMSGAWAVQVDVAGPVRDRVARTLQIDPCDGDRRCPVPAPPAAAARQP
jgi:hypothetical protein